MNHASRMESTCPANSIQVSWSAPRHNSTGSQGMMGLNTGNPNTLLLGAASALYSCLAQPLPPMC
jgi:hypothetical protein